MYTPLYIKTDYSIMSSLIKIDDLVKYAKDNNIDALAVADDNMCYALPFYEACKSAGIKPIIGLEYKKDNINIAIFAKNYDGYKNLLKISSTGILEDKSNLVCISLDDKSYGFEYEYKASDIGAKDILYFNKDDYKYLSYLYAIKEGVKIEEVNVLKNDNYFNIDKNEYNREFVSLCNLEIKRDTNLLPEFCLNPTEELKSKCIKGIKNRFGSSVSIKYKERLKHELSVIEQMGFCNYFLIVSDYVKFAKDNGILVGPGRGSAAGSLVSYVLGITDIDPLRYNLLFERFLNPMRQTMPDIDIDFEVTRRDEVIEYCRNKYGRENVAGIITYSTLKTKQVLRDVAKTLDIEIDKYTKDIDSKLSLKENSSNFEFDPDFKKIYEIALKLENIKRHNSSHASGIVISKNPIYEVAPIVHDTADLVGYTMNYIEGIGLLKMDFLGLKNLSLIANIKQAVKIKDIPLNDTKTFELFSNGLTDGIFQFESSGMKSVLKRFKPESMEDLFLIIALYRPGPMKNIDEVIKRKNGKKYTVLNGLEDILKNTYGIIVYQEQIMQISNALAGYTLGEADILRRAISKKKSDVLLREKSKFVKRCIENNIEERDATRIFDLIYEFASYGFNKAHSVSYSYLSYYEAYLKANYKEYFYCELLNYKANMSEYIKDSKRMGVEFVRPVINNVVTNFEVINNKVYIPLDIIKGVSRHHASVFKDKFDSIFDFVVKTKIEKNLLTNLIYAGVFDTFENRKTLIENIDTILDYADIPLVDPNLVPILENTEEYDKFELLEKEKSVFGFYLEHPVSMYKKGNIVDIKDVANYFNKDINIVALVDRVNDTTTKKHEKMGFASVSDEEASIDLVLFPSVRSQYELVDGNIILVNGRVERRREKYQIIVNKVKVLNVSE